MLRSAISIIFCLFFLLIAGCKIDQEGKVNELIELGMYDQAIVILDNQIIRTPKEPQLHFLLAKCYLAKDNIEKAQESFNRAIQIDFKYSMLIGKAYLDESLVALKNNNIRKQDALFPLALKYDPSLSSKIGEIYFNDGVVLLKSDNIRNSISFFDRSLKFDPTINDRIGQALFDEAKNKIEQGKTNDANILFAKSYHYSAKLNSDISKMYINAAIDAIDKDNLENVILFSKGAKSFGINSSKEISRKALEKAKYYSTSSANYEKVLAYARVGLDIDSSSSASWGLLLFQSISINDMNITNESLVDLYSQAMEWNPNLNSDIIAAYFKRIDNIIQSDSPNYKSLYFMLNAVVGARNSEKERAAGILWGILLKNIPSLTSLDKWQFINMFKIYESFGVSSETKNSDNYKFAQALVQYADGTKSLALSAFKLLMKNASNSAVVAKSEKILAFPKAATIDYSSSNYLKVHIDEFLAKLLNVRIESKSIALQFSLKNPYNQDNIFWYVPKPNKGDGIFQNPYDGLYILDDNGIKHYAITEFMGGKQQTFSTGWKQILLNASEEATVIVSFPMISEGSRKFTFVSPSGIGQIWGWSWPEITLKPDPFEY